LRQKTLSMFNRRDIIRQAVLSALAARVGRGKSRFFSAVEPALNSRAINALELEPFVDPLPLPQRMEPEQRRHTIAMREIRVKMHRDLPLTRVWSYGSEALGPLLECQTNQELVVEWRNQLPSRHFLPIDFSLHGSGRELPESRTVVHLHGGRTPAEFDGYPEDWFPTGKSRVCRYPNRQSAAMLWYHDHAIGTSRLNLYAGLMGLCILRDAEEARLNLPSGRYELPLVLYDRIFDREGQLLYPVSQDPAHPWVDDVMGDAMLVNGRVQPFYEVEPECYRLRLLNASNGRFFRLAWSNGMPFQQIGADQGLLPELVKLPTLLLAPGERADLIVDFSATPGQRIVLNNGAMRMMQFRVASSQKRRNRPAMGKLESVMSLAEEAAVRRREMTLNEFRDSRGNPVVMLLNRTPWHARVTETAKLGSSEIWSLVNLTEDTHPIHLHHVRFQVLDRRPFDQDAYLMKAGELRFTGDALKPNPNERGWKDVVPCPPGMVTRIHISFAGFPGRYLWHCHVQEHEANDMMRPYEIVV
jgi:spore coat protein A, manganese oxidase